MLGRRPFYNKTIEYITTAVGALFSQVYITRPPASGKGVERYLKVPIVYAPKHFRTSRDDGNPDLQREIGQNLPMISYQLVDIEKLTDGGVSPLNKITLPLENGGSTVTLVPQPYKFTYEIYVKVNRQPDGFQIMEQIMSSFRPTLTASINFIEGVKAPQDLVLFMNDINHEDNFEQQPNTNRVVIWTFNISANGWIYGEVNTNGPGDGDKGRIKKIQIDFHPTLDQPGTRIERIEIQPGLTELKEPTTDRTKSISHLLITADDPFGICTDITTYDDGKYYDPVTDTDID